jgi:hypothetical protein
MPHAGQQPGIAVDRARTYLEIMGSDISGLCPDCAGEGRTGATPGISRVSCLDGFPAGRGSCIYSRWRGNTCAYPELESQALCSDRGRTGRYLSEVYPITGAAGLGITGLIRHRLSLCILLFRVHDSMRDWRRITSALIGKTRSAYQYKGDADLTSGSHPLSNAGCCRLTGLQAGFTGTGVLQ